MKLLLLSLIGGLALPAATPYTWGTTIRLSGGANKLTVVHAPNGVETSTKAVVVLPLNSAAYQKVTFWPTRYVVSKNETGCADPCSLAMPLQYGNVKYFVQRFNAANVQLSQSDWFDLQGVFAPPTSSFTLPLEVIGFEGYTRSIALTTQSNVNTGGAIRLLARTHGLSYDGKGRVRVNLGAWVSLSKSTATVLGQAGQITMPTLQTPYETFEWTVNLPAGAVANGQNRVDFQFFKENDQEESGYRVLAVNFLQPDITVSSVTVAGTTATVTAPSHGMMTGDDCRVENFRGHAYQIEGKHTNIAVIDANSFRFTVPAGTPAGTYAYLANPVKVAKLMVDEASFTQEDPSAWTAPAGADAAAGETAWRTAVNLTPHPPRGTDPVLGAKCSSCHAQDGRDLKYFNYSNWSIQVRSQFHGFSETQGRNTAAYIRSHASAAPGRPWNPPYQPCPNADAVSAYIWSGACSIDDVLPWNMGMYQQMFGSNGPDAADFDPARTDINFRTLRTDLQFPTWNKWLPRIHPGDWWNTAYNQVNYPGGYWETNGLKVAYDNFRTLYSAACPGAGCAAHLIANQEQAGNLMGSFSGRSPNLYNSGPTYFEGNPPHVEGVRDNWTRQAHNSVASYSSGLFTLTKQWEMSHEFDLQDKWISVFPTAEPKQFNIRNLAFVSSPNLLRFVAGGDPVIPGIFDGTSKAEKIISMQWYWLAGVLNPNTQKCCPQQFDPIQPLDSPYVYGYFFDFHPIGLYMPLGHLWWTMVNYQRQINNDPSNVANGGIAANNKAWQPYTVGPHWLSVNGGHKGWYAMPAEDRSTLRPSIMNAAALGFKKMVCGEVANGTHGVFTSADWAAGDYYSDIVPLYLNFELASGNYRPTLIMWHLASYGRMVGISASTIDEFEACSDARWPGPTTTLNGAINSSATSMAIGYVSVWWPDSDFQFAIGSEKISCAARSGANFSGCTRGAAGTAAASHANGDTVQYDIRWERARTHNCYYLDSQNVEFQCNPRDPKP